MKIFLPALIILLVSLFYLNESLSSQNHLRNKINSSRIAKDYPDPSLRYDLKAELTDDNRLLVEEKITWINTTAFPAANIKLLFSQGPFQNDSAGYSDQYMLPVQKALLNGRPIPLAAETAAPSKNNKEYLVPFNKPVNQGDTLEIFLEIAIDLPSKKRLFMAEGRRFLMFSEWYAKVPAYKNGEWLTSEKNPYGLEYLDFASFNTEITLTENLTVDASGILTDSVSSDGKTKLSFHSPYGRDFAWFAAKDIKKFRYDYFMKDGGTLPVTLYLQPESESFLERYKKSIRQSLDFSIARFGEYPFSFVKMIDLPRTYYGEPGSFPGMFQVRSEFLSPGKSLTVEERSSKGIFSQYFSEALSIDERAEKWLDEGLTLYLSQYFGEKYYGGKQAYFDIVTYFPIPGINFLSYNEIPIIYTLGNYPFPPVAKNLPGYYENMLIGSVSDSTVNLPDMEAYITNTSLKPALMFHIADQLKNKNSLVYSLAQYYKTNKFGYAESADLFRVMKKTYRGELDWFLENIYRETHIFDYAVTGLKALGPATYEVTVKRIGDGVFRNSVSLLTEKDTLSVMWSGEERWKKFIFKTDNEVTAAAVDLERKNLLDVNYSNNSLTVDKRYWASWSLSVRWFFWLQNALTIMGSIG